MGRAKEVCPLLTRAHPCSLAAHSRQRSPNFRHRGIKRGMPELPEVETIKEDLRALVVGSKIEEARVLDPALVEGVTPEEFARRLEGTVITGARRRAKHLVVELDGG